METEEERLKRLKEEACNIANAIRYDREVAVSFAYELFKSVLDLVECKSRARLIRLAEATLKVADAIEEDSK